jgi:serine/threonine-protein kinase
VSAGTSRLVPGGRLGRYELLEELGRGGMGMVFKARDPAIGRLVAIKTLHLELLAATGYRAEAEARFAREAQAIGQLSHPNIVTLFDAQQEGDVLYIVMELVAGQSLEALLRAEVTFPIAKVCAIGMDVCEALHHAHERGVIHRDIKPDNILLQDNGTVKVADFGIAYLAMSALTRPGESIGTPSYMSPEQIAGKTVDRRSDLFSLGAVLYELSSRRKAFSGETIATVIYRILHEEPASLHELNPFFPPLFNQVIRTALAKNPAERYATAREMAEALSRAGSETAPSIGYGAVPGGAATPSAPPRTRARRGWLAWSAAAAALALAAGLWLLRAPAPLPTVAVPPASTGSAVSSAPAPVAEPKTPLGATAESPPPATSGSPHALRVTFARDIKGLLPVEEGDTFYRDDRQVVLWVRWANVRGRHRVVARWFDPEGTLVHASPRPESFDAPAEAWTTWTALPLRRGTASKSPGRWRAELQLDNRTAVVTHFTLVNQRRPKGAASALGGQ